MAQPLYFLPDLRAAQAETVALRRMVLRERGLADLFADVGHDQFPFFELPSRGPADKSGCILCAQSASGSIPRRMGYFPDEQRWTPIGDGSQAWIGLDTAEPPKPDEMRRVKVYADYTVTLGDGQRWSFPVIRRKDGGTELPTDFTWDSSGRFMQSVKERFEPLWHDWKQVVNQFWRTDETEPMDVQACAQFAIRALGINYRIGIAEQQVLRLIDSESLFLVLAATVDFQAEAANG